MGGFGDGRDAQSVAAVSCGSCGVRLPLNSRFCHQCGAAVASAGRSAEYKQVTVLFADVVRSMQIAASVDIERLREIMTELVERSASVARRFGGTVEYTGDGVMAIFGAPVALEDHAFRACLAALAIQQEAARLAGEVRQADKVELSLRVGLNSGRVIAGDVGSAGYRATGETVGLAQRMESVAASGGVMLSESTAALVGERVTMAAPEWVRIKGFEDPVCARRLTGIGPRRSRLGIAETTLVGRHHEMNTLDTAVARAVDGRGGVVGIVGAPGVGKSRAAREAAARAVARGAEVFWGFCESHARDVPFHAVTRLLRDVAGVADLGGVAARERLRTSMPAADPRDLLLLDDLLGIADANVPLPQMDSDTRRRRLTDLVNSRALARDAPALFIIEDAHWIDPVSESLLADFLAVIPRTASMVLITYRPEYRSALSRVPGSQTIELELLVDSDIAALLAEVLGADPSIGELASIIVERAAGNPFFAEEIVREFVQRGVLTGAPGDYRCAADVAEVSVPVTVQAAIAARIDRLSPPGRQTLNAASVIGARFGAGLLAQLGIDPVYDELLAAELIDQVRANPYAEFAFHHPLIHAVAYDSQLKSDRAGWHRRLAATMERCAPQGDENAALIAEHLEAAGDLTAAYRWHMRAATWSTNRDIGAARTSWQRARRIADVLPEDDPEQLSMRIAPRTMLCATDSQAREAAEGKARFAELQQLCNAAGDTVSLAIGMSALSTELCFAGRVREAARVSTQQMALLESIADPTPAMGLSLLAFVNWLRVAEFGEILRWSQKIVDLAGGDPDKGAGFGVGSPLAGALAWRGTARWWLGRPGWRDDLHTAVATARMSTPDTLAAVIAWSYGFAMHYGVLRADDAIIGASEAALQTAQEAGNDRALDLTTYTLAVALLNQDDPIDRRRGLDLVRRAREIWLAKRAHFLIPVTDVWIAREAASHGDPDAALQAVRRAVDELRETGNLFYGFWGTGVLAEMLLQRDGAGDLTEAEAAVDWLGTLCADTGSAVLEVALVKLRALLARRRGDTIGYRGHRDRYADLAANLGFEEHLTWAVAMP
ncbi:adenylate/guanylate cyclase domain-containing protein [Mycobacterium sp. shizuoka-1]|uniref:adenylate/guanylate cyclase domain-containing protein n=1 Tax=Mycobacterium sp. shizuoka-1 TaxID=2039281 RepID=UPI000C065E7F|nr:adenylate/guanylate cyclase domain-containing protein [Mycobacterium sp. shizuoka-1]GAY15077.1 cyclase [Mycobacterium sp. shizuoka-1]